MNTPSSRRPSSRPACLALSILVAACEPGPPGDPAARAKAASEAAAARAFVLRSYSLTIVGYNYTDTEIGSYEVDGVGGGNIEVSTPTIGGSKATCCAAIYSPPPTRGTVRIRWSRDGDTWCDLQVPYPDPIPTDAKYFQTHFYADGHIELAAAVSHGPPRLALERLHGNSRHVDPAKNVNNDSKFATCVHGYR